MAKKFIAVFLGRGSQERSFRMQWQKQMLLGAARETVCARCK